MRDLESMKEPLLSLGRRDFLRLLGGGMATLGWGRSSWAQEAAARAVTGVTSDAIKIGMSAAFSGTAESLGVEYYRGSMAYYNEVNDQGGVHGRRVILVPVDDGYNPVPTINNTIRLVEEERVFMLSNYVGTPTLTRALPVIKRYEDEGLLLVGNFTGAQPQREPPYAGQVFNIRASYRQEMMSLVDRFWRAGLRKMGVFYQIDAYGRSGTDGVARGLAEKGSEIVAEATYRRGSGYDFDMSAAARHLREAGVDAVLCTGSYQECGAFVRAARDMGWNVPISNVSFVSSDAMLALLLQTGRETGRDYTRALINSQVVPSYDDISLPGVARYRGLMDKWTPQPPAGLVRDDYEPIPYSFTSLEGFLNARVIYLGLAAVGPDLTRPGFRAALEGMADVDIGVGANIGFSPDQHQGLDTVYFTYVKDGRWVPVVDWAAALRAQEAA